MSQEDIDALLAQEAELQKQIQALAEKRRELEEAEKHRQLMLKPIDVRVSKFDIQEQRVIFNLGGTIRTDVVDYITSLGCNMHGAGAFSLTRDGFLTMLGEYLSTPLAGLDGNTPPDFKFVWRDMTPERDTVNVYTKIIHNERTPDYVVDIDKKQYSVVLYNNAPANPFGNIPGTRWAIAKDNIHNNILVPLSEGWRLYENLTRESMRKYLVKWSDEALSTAIAQAEKRNKLIAIMSADDWPTVDPKFVGIDPDTQKPYALRPFQRVGVAYAQESGGRWMCWDEMGLGKTWQELAFVWMQIQERRAAKLLDPKVRKYKALFVVPANLIINWRREITKLTGINAHILSGRMPNDHDMAAMMTGVPEIFLINYDAIATRVKIPPQKSTAADGRDVWTKEDEAWPWVDLINNMGFAFIGFDEGHYLKNSDSLRSQAARMLKNTTHASIATGTPVVNRVDELWPLLNIIDPDTFPYEATFTNQYGDGKYVRNVDQLREILKFISIRRLKKDVIKDLPPINEIIKYYEMPAKARKLYEKVLAGVYTIMADWDQSKAGAQQEVTSMLAQIMRLKQIASIAKIDYVADLAVEQYDSAPEGERNNKVIIFTQFVPVAKAIARRLGQECVLLTGEVEQGVARTLIEDEFQNNDNIHFLVATKGVAQEGLNLTRAGYIIKADLFWTPKDHDQCIGRAYGRLSNLHGANVTYVVAEDTIEEWIQELIHGKRVLIGQVVDGRVVTGDESVANELLKRMRDEMFRARNRSDKRAS